MLCEVGTGYGEDLIGEGDATRPVSAWCRTSWLLVGADGGDMYGLYVRIG